MTRPIAHKRQPVTASIERDIHNAVEHLSSSIHNSMSHSDASDDHDGEKKPPRPRPTDSAALERKKRGYLWLFVTILAVTVFAIWFLNVATVIFDVKRTDSQEKRLYDEANEAMRDAFAAFSIETSETKDPTPTTVTTSTLDAVTETLKQAFQNTSSTTSTSP